ncbi:hypothetical protein [Flexithrix dorotheae]|uniref:hypothetical protein n=1 Tax=Flexithrix dorotheae TaxID=70993 RepID=UPI0003693AD8|nr:hypothetical protein [Flexithrix dorotheae]
MKTLKKLLIVAVGLFGISNAHAQLELEVNQELEQNTKLLVKQLDEISEERKSELTEIGNFLVNQLEEKDAFSALFVCTHNSRRSHISDVWFKYALLFYGVEGLESFSGGTEATAFNPHAIAALERAGFTIHYNKNVDNPVVSVTPGKYPVWKMKSKVYTHKINPTSDFAAIMVCSDADKSCPVVSGATGRFSLPFKDPRYYDGTPSQDLKYDETVQEIGKEMFFLADHIKSQLIIKKEILK